MRSSAEFNDDRLFTDYSGKSWKRGLWGVNQLAEERNVQIITRGLNTMGKNINYTCLYNLAQLTNAPARKQIEKKIPMRDEEHVSRKYKTGTANTRVPIFK